MATRIKPHHLLDTEFYCTIYYCCEHSQKRENDSYTEKYGWALSVISELNTESE